MGTSRAAQQPPQVQKQKKKQRPPETPEEQIIRKTEKRMADLWLSKMHLIDKKIAYLQGVIVGADAGEEVMKAIEDLIKEVEKIKK